MLLDAVNEAVPPETGSREPYTSPCKYALYNDCLAGIFDPLIDPSDEEKFLPIAEKLKEAEGNPHWGILFKKARLLSETLQYKYALGVKTRELYRAGDKRGILRLIQKGYKPAIRKLKEFYRAFADEWEEFNRPQGFEVQDARLGGLLLRMEHCKNRLLDYARGRVTRLPELEEELLDPTGNGKECVKRSVVSPEYAACVTTNVV